MTDRPAGPDSPYGPSGSRWEPGPDQDDQPAAEHPAPPPRTGRDAASGLRLRCVGVPVAAAIAAGLVAVSAAGGYALGRADHRDDLTPESFTTQHGATVPGLPPAPAPAPGGGQQWGQPWEHDDDGEGLDPDGGAGSGDDDGAGDSPDGGGTSGSGAPTT